MLIVDAFTTTETSPVPTTLDVAGTDNWIEPFENPTVCAPPPWNSSELALSTVDELPCVLLVAYSDMFAFDCAATDADKVPTPTPVDRPNDTPLILENVSPDSAFEVPPAAETFTA
jgi:hypothetical protein